MAFNYRLQYWEARFPNNCTGSINISSAAAAPLPRVQIHFVRLLLLPPTLSLAHLLPLIIITKINEAETRMKKKKENTEEEYSRRKPLSLNIMHFSRNPSRSSRARLQIRFASDFSTVRTIFARRCSVNFPTSVLSALYAQLLREASLQS
jgi:hypothetical protein